MTHKGHKLKLETKTVKERYSAYHNDYDYEDTTYYRYKISGPYFKKTTYTP